MLLFFQKKIALIIRSLCDSVLAEDFVYRPPYEQKTFTIKHVMQYHFKIVKLYISNIIAKVSHITV